MRQILLISVAVLAGTDPACNSREPSYAGFQSDFKCGRHHRGTSGIPDPSIRSMCRRGAGPAWQETLPAKRTERKPVHAGSFPNAGSIIGVDRRARVKSTTEFPARATTFITFRQGTFRLSCTGWLIGKDTVATAGHCINGGPGFEICGARTSPCIPGAMDHRCRMEAAARKSSGPTRVG